MICLYFSLASGIILLCLGARRSPPRDPQQIIDDLTRQTEQLREDLLRSEIERNRLRRQ